MQSDGGENFFDHSPGTTCPDLTTDQSPSPRRTRFQKMRTVVSRIFGSKRSQVSLSVVLSRSTSPLTVTCNQSRDKPLLSRNSHNVFHEQALAQLASTYESLQWGDSHEATAKVRVIAASGRSLNADMSQPGLRTGRTDLRAREV